MYAKRVLRRLSSARNLFINLWLIVMPRIMARGCSLGLFAYDLERNSNQLLYCSIEASATLLSSKASLSSASPFSYSSFVISNVLPSNVNHADRFGVTSVRLGKEEAEGNAASDALALHFGGSGCRLERMKTGS